MKDLQFSQLFDKFLDKKLKYANLMAFYFDNNGNVYSLLAKMILCKDSFEDNVYVSLRFQRMNENCEFKVDIDSMIVVIELLIINQGLCIICNDNIIIVLVIRRGLEAETSIGKVHIDTTAPIVIKKGISPLRIECDVRISLVTAHHILVTLRADKDQNNTYLFENL